MANNITAFENVGDIGRVPVKGFHVLAFPMKIKGRSDGTPGVAALLPNK